MAKGKLDNEQKKRLIADLSIGKFTLIELAKKYGVSTSAIHKYSKLCTEDGAKIVQSGVAYKSALSRISDPLVVEKIRDEVDDIVNRMKFFSDSALRNQNLANEKINEGSSLFELQAHSKITALNKETVCGKSPETAININNENKKKKNKLTVEFKDVV